jgi:hypothetical protein
MNFDLLVWGFMIIPPDFLISNSSILDQKSILAGWDKDGDWAVAQWA